MNERTLLRVILGVVSIVVAIVGSLLTSNANAYTMTTHAVTYCETWSTDHGPMTVISTDDGHETFVKWLTVRNAPVIGERDLVESPVVRHRPRVMHCMIRSVNGNHTMILTTYGGAEWHVTNPGVVR